VSQKLFHDSLETQNPSEIQVNHPNKWLASAIDTGIIASNAISASQKANAFSSNLGGAA
jgi:hypothetical protein